MKSLVLGSSLILLANAAGASLPPCTNASTGLTHLENGKVVQWKDAYCTGLPDYPVISENCRASSGCDALNAFRNAKPGVPLTGFANANPYHARCSALGGVPILVNITEKGKDQETAICFFKRDRSFVSVFSKTGKIKTDR